MRKLSIFLLLVISITAAMAQAIRLKSDDFDPEKPCTFVIDLNKTPDSDGNTGGSAAIMAAAEAGAKVYIWTWNPGGDGLRDPEDKNGEWASSNETMAGTYLGGGIVEFNLNGKSPVDFYKVDAKTVYDNDFSMLVKLKDGSKANGVEPKTADLILEVAPPSYRIFSIPPRKAPTNDSTFSRSSEVMTIFYDNKLETNAAMQGVDSVVIFYRVTLSNGQTVAPLSFNNSKNNVKLAMDYLGNGVFRKQFIPELFFRDAAIFDPAKVPAGVTITAVECQFVKKGTSTSAASPNYKMVFSDCP